MYGFRRHHNIYIYGKVSHAYIHPNFIRGRLDLVVTIQRVNLNKNEVENEIYKTESVDDAGRVTSSANTTESIEKKSSADTDIVISKTSSKDQVVESSNPKSEQSEYIIGLKIDKLETSNIITENHNSSDSLTSRSESSNKKGNKRKLNDDSESSTNK